MPDYIRYDGTGKILERYISHSSELSGADILEVSRDVINSITEYHIVDGGVIRLMTQAEKDIYESANARAIIDAENERLANLDTKISNAKITDFTMAKVDTAIDAIANLTDAKTFLKRLCRYVAKNL